MKEQKAQFELCEGISGYWHYHLRHKGASEALCGTKGIMSCNSPLNSWGFKSSHLLYSYCSGCEKIAQKLGLQLKGKVV